MKLLEKLGITPGPWKGLHGEGIYRRGNKRIISDWVDIAILIKSKHDTSNAQLIAAAPQLFTDEVDNKEDAHKAMIELEKELPDLHRVFNLLGNIVARSANGAEKATGKSWQEIQQLMEE